MKVTFVVANYAPSVGGAQLLVQHVAEGLVQRHGHEVAVVTTDALLSPGGRDVGRVPVERERIGGVDVLRRPVARRAHSLVRSVRRLAQRLGVAAVDRPTRLLAAGPLGARFALAARRAGRDCDAVVGVSASFLTLPEAQRFSSRGSAVAVSLPLLHLSVGSFGAEAMRVMRRSDRTVALTEYERDWLVANGVDAAATVVVPAGCDPGEYEELSPSAARRRLGLPERPTVGYVGRMVPHKGVDTLLDAAERMWPTRGEMQVLLAGNSAGWNEFDTMTGRVRDIVGDRLQVRPAFSTDDKPLLLAACDVVAFPSREESFGIVTLESWCARRPVVAGDIDAVRSVIRSGRDGDVVAVDDAEQWAAALGALLDDPDRRERYGREGRRRAEQEFAWTAVVDRWHELLVDAVASRGSARRDAAVS